jgi:hypothetical protein
MENTVTSKIAALSTLLNELNADAVKTENGNKSAGTRVRKALQEVINSSKEIRKEIIELRNTDA